MLLHQRRQNLSFSIVVEPQGKVNKQTGKDAAEERTLSARLHQAVLSPQRRAFAESGAANATSHYDPSRENAKPERPQTLRLCSIKNNFSAIYAQSNAARISNRPAPGKPLFRLGVIAQHPMARAQFPPRGGRGGVVVHGGVVDQQLFLPLPARVRHGNGG